MDFYVDDRKSDTATAEDAVLGDLVDETKSRLVESGRIIVGILCDGIDAADSGLTETLKRPRSDFDRIDMQTADPSVLVVDALQTAGEILDESEKNINEIVDLLSRGQTEDALPKLSTCCRDWLEVQDAIANSLGMLGINVEAFEINGQSVAIQLATPLKQLQHIKEVVEARDFVLLSDTLAYEFPEAIAAWRGLIGAVSEVADSTYSN